jgi:hypothetical protein
MANEDYEDVQQWENEMANPDAFDAMERANASDADGWAMNEDFPFTDEQLLGLVSAGGAAYAAYKMALTLTGASQPAGPDVTRASIRLKEWERRPEVKEMIKRSRETDLKSGPMRKRPGMDVAKKNPAIGGKIDQVGMMNRDMGKGNWPMTPKQGKLYNDGKNTFNFPKTWKLEKVQAEIDKFYEQTGERNPKKTKFEKSGQIKDIKGLPVKSPEEFRDKQRQHHKKKIEERNKKSVNRIKGGRAAYSAGGAIGFGDGTHGIGKPPTGRKGPY